MYPIQQTVLAKTDLEGIIEHLEKHSPKAADRFVESHDHKMHLLQQFPLMGRSREELGPDIRSVVVERHIVYYRVKESEIEILRILHGKRDASALL